MKAIVILFSGAFKSKAHQNDAMSNIAGVLNETTNTEEITMRILDDTDVTKALVSASDKVAVIAKVDNTEKLINDFCHEILCKVGDPTQFNNEISFKVHFLKAFMNDDSIRKRNTDILKYLITTGKLQPAHKKILEANHLSNIPDYLKEFNNILKFF